MNARKRLTGLISVGLMSTVVFGAAAALAQDKPSALTVLGTTTHKRVITEGKGGDVTPAFQQGQGVGVQWVILENGPIQERFLRELELPQTSIDVAFMLNTQAMPRVTGLLEPLDSYMAKNPIEDSADMFPSLAKAMVFDGKTYGVPFRHASSCLHYNARLFKEAGLQPPTTAEEMVSDAIALSKGGVYGFNLNAKGYQNIIFLARAWNGDFITTDYKLAVTGPGMTKAVETLREFYEKGVLPKSWATTSSPDLINWMQSGRAAMTISSCGDNQVYNRPEASKEAGNIVTVPLPTSAALKDQIKGAGAVEFWSLVIPKNSTHKDLAWAFIREMTNKANTLKEAMNGNGPVRVSTYETSELQAAVPYAAAEKAVLLAGRIPLPAFDNAAKATDIFVENVQAAVLGMMPVDQSLKAIQDRVQPLLPR